ncbi:MAG: ABC transporter ATP-binding protein [Thermomicrobiales bacterium]
MSADAIPAGSDGAGRVPRWRDVLRLCREMLRARPWPFLLLVIVTVVGNARTGAYILAMGGLTQALITRDERAGYLWAAVFAVTTLIEESYWAVKGYLASIVTDHATFVLQRRVLAKASSAPLVAFEHGPFHARLQRAADNLGQRLSGAFTVVLDLTQVAIMLGSVLAALWFVRPVIVLLVCLGAVPALLLQGWVATRVHDALERHARTDRLVRRLGDILASRSAAAEVRIFGNAPDLVGRWRGARANRADDVLQAERSVAAATAWGQVGVIAAISIALAVTLGGIQAGNLDVGAWVVVLQGVQWAMSILFIVPAAVRSAREQTAFLGDLFRFEDEADALLGVLPAPVSDPDEVAQRESSDIDLASGMDVAADAVSFRYPGQDRAVIDGVTLRLAPGERVALVGENGAGKSTLVRVLTGLYLPTAGVVRLDGIDTAEPRAAALRAGIGAVFQEVVAYQVTAREAIGFGDLGRLQDDAAILRATVQAGIEEVVRALPDGLDSALGREFGERDLSGGEWQRIALARAFLRDARLLILDEPTAALDPKAEQAVFARFAELAAGRTALMISHRLGPARFADRILVMHAGRIVEAGTHDDLVAANGHYAAMWAAQAAWYR